MAEGLSVQLSRELCDSRLGEPLWHPRNEPWRKQRKCQRAGKDFSSANISWPPAAEWLEQRESPEQVGEQSKEGRGTQFCSLRIFMSQNWWEQGVSRLSLPQVLRQIPALAALPAVSAPLQPREAFPLCRTSPSDKSHIHNLTSTISCAIVNERKLRYNSSRAHSPFPRQRLISTPFSLNKFPSAVTWSCRFYVTPCPSLLPYSLSPNHLPSAL